MAFLNSIIYFKRNTCTPSGGVNLSGFETWVFFENRVPDKFGVEYVVVMFLDFFILRLMNRSTLKGLGLAETLSGLSL